MSMTPINNNDHAFHSQQIPTSKKAMTEANGGSTSNLEGYPSMTPSYQDCDPQVSTSHQFDDIARENCAFENSQASQILTTHSQIESLTQMDCTQHSQIDEPSYTPLSPPAPTPWARLVPCVPSLENPPVDLLLGKSEYWIGRSSARCDIPVHPGTSLSKKESAILSWAHSMISNRHCRVIHLGPVSSKVGMSDSSRGYCEVEKSQQEPQILIEDHSGNGTFVNQSAHLRKGHQRVLHNGDEICLVNADTLRKRITSSRLLRSVLQQFTYVLVMANKPKRPCVNPRAMNYGGLSQGMDRGVASPRSARRIEAHYEIREILGDGTSGQVRRAIHRQTGQEYAVKVVSLRRHFDLTSMEHEVNMMQSLDHPYIVQLVDVFVHHGIAMYLVMELVAGGDLFDRIVQQQRYSEVDARRVMRRLLSALHYLHQTKNIVHRDLKPENILCASPTHVKLADFGLAKIIQSDGLKTFCGTPQYFAPEVLQRRTTVAGSGRYGKPADMWSLGVILYILLAGRPPFEADLDPLQSFDAIDFDDPIWKGMPLAQELVQQMLRIDPKRRVSVRQACDHPWINIDDGDTHVHPLDDPAVTGRKRLFSESNEQNIPPDVQQVQNNSDCSVSKESILTKEDFAAAATSLQRVESIDFLNIQKVMDQPLERDDVSTPVPPPSDVSSLESAVSKMECVGDTPEKLQRNMEHCVDEKSPDNHQDLPIDHDPETDLVSPIVSTTCLDHPMSGLMVRELSVTPSECGDHDMLPRSPLAAMNLNERSNRFRAHVLGQQNPDMSEIPSLNFVSSPARHDSRDGSQNAVTPNVSTMPQAAVATGQPSGAIHGEEVGNEDPILSQFSSEPSSLDSFPESPVKEPPSAVTKSEKPIRRAKKTQSPTKKRKRREVPKAEHETETTEQGKASQPSDKQRRQTNLSSWLLSKKQKIDTN